MGQLNIDSGADKLALWLRHIQSEGKSCPTNIVQSAKTVLNCSLKIARLIKAKLIAEKRLVVNPLRHIYRIDGFDFHTKVQDRSPLDDVIRTLQQRYPQVHDARISADPHHVPEGPPRELVIGTLVVPVHAAIALAARLRDQGARP